MRRFKYLTLAAVIAGAQAVVSIASAQSDPSSNAPATRAVPASKAIGKSKDHADSQKLSSAYKRSQMTNPPGGQPGTGAGMGKTSGTPNGN